MLMKGSKDEYREICRTEETIPLFSKDYWMDSVCGEDNWSAIVYKKNNGDLIGAFVFYIIKEDEGRRIKKAPLTQNNGIWINRRIFDNIYAFRKYEEMMMDEVIEDIYNMDLASYDQQYHYSITNWLPFFWEYFQCVVRYTYVIDTTRTIEEIFNSFSKNNRNCIRKAEKIVKIRDDLKASEFYEINKMTYERQEINIPYTEELFLNIENICEKYENRKILSAVDEDGNIHAAIYLVWDESSLYYLFSGSNPDYRNSQANSLLIFEGIKLAKKLGRKFDFEGSVIRRVEKNVRQFGGTQMPYFKIFKTLGEK